MKSSRIAILEDDPQVRTLLADFLRARGHDPWILPEGTAVEAIEPPDLFLIDIGLPGTDGLSLTRSLRARGATADTPIIVLTGRSDPSLVGRALGGGADDFLYKPVNLDELDSRVVKLIRQHRAFGRLDAERRHLERLQRISARLNDADDDTAMAEALVEQAVEDRPEWIACFYRPNMDGTAWRLAASSHQKGAVSGAFQAASDPLLAEVLHRGGPVARQWSRPDEVPPRLAAWLRPRAVGRALAVPLTDRGTVLGVLALLGPPGAPDMDEADRRLIETMAEIAVAPLRIAGRLDLAERTLEHERSQLERAADFQHVFERANEPLVMLTGEGIIERANPGFLSLVEAADRPLEGRDLLDFAAPPDKPRLAAVLESAPRLGLIPPLDLTITTLEGKAVPVMGKGLVLPGEARRLVMSLRDMTQEHRLRNELLDTMDFLQNVIANSVDAIIAVNRQGTLVLFNHASERLTGWRSEEAVGRMSVRRIYRAGVAERVMRDMRSASHGGAGRVVNYEVEILDRHGQPIPIVLNASILYKNGQEAGSVGLFSDRRETIRYQAELKQRQEELMTLAQKQEIIAELAGAAAHDLNQPLTVLLGYLELLRQHRAGDRFDHIVETLLKEAERLRDKIQRLGRLTRYETRGYAGTRRILDVLKSSDSES